MRAQPGTEQDVPAALIPGRPAALPRQSGVVNIAKNRDSSTTGLHRRHKDMVSKVSSLY